MNFDRVELDHPDGTTRTYSPHEYRKLSPVDRVQWVSQGRFRFFRLETKIPAREALKVAT
jgi:hypothetical protein